MHDITVTIQHIVAFEYFKRDQDVDSLNLSPTVTPAFFSLLPSSLAPDCSFCFHYPSSCTDVRICSIFLILMYLICPSAQCVKKLNSAAAVPKICEPHYFSTHCSSCFGHKYASSNMFHILFMWLPVLGAWIISCKSFFLRF